MNTQVHRHPQGKDDMKGEGERGAQQSSDPVCAGPSGSQKISSKTCEPRFQLRGVCKSNTQRECSCSQTVIYTEQEELWFPGQACLGSGVGAAPPEFNQPPML